jgi:hypothetical protein
LGNKTTAAMLQRFSFCLLRTLPMKILFQRKVLPVFDQAENRDLVFK